MKNEFSLTILDDDEQYAKLLLEVAQSEGWQAEYCDSALAFIQDLPDSGVLVLDLVMPDVDGIEVIRALARAKSNVTLILISGFDSRVLHSAKELARAHNIEVVASLTKPIAVTEFALALAKIKPQSATPAKSTHKTSSVSEEELANAIANRQLQLYYQPQVNFKDGLVHGFEALVRWHHPEKGLVMPNDFIELAEQTGLIEPLTKRVLEMAISQLRDWNSNGLKLNVSVNVSAANVLSLNLPEYVSTMLRGTDVEPQQLTLELTETGVMEELTSSLDVLNRLRMKGFALSIDDFGTGYSSLSKLYEVPFTELKIDRRFVANIHSDEEAMVIVKICTMLGQMLSMQVVAEGVENQQIWRSLRDLGVGIAQGYYIAKPIPADDVKDWYNRWQVRVGDYV